MFLTIKKPSLQQWSLPICMAFFLLLSPALHAVNEEYHKPRSFHYTSDSVSSTSSVNSTSSASSTSSVNSVVTVIRIPRTNKPTSSNTTTETDWGSGTEDTISLGSEFEDEGLVLEDRWDNNYSFPIESPIQEENQDSATLEKFTHNFNHQFDIATLKSAVEKTAQASQKAPPKQYKLPSFTGEVSLSPTIALIERQSSNSHLRQVSSIDWEQTESYDNNEETSYQIGNCLFDAIAAFDIKGRSGKELRRLAVEHIINDPQLRMAIEQAADNGEQLRIGNGNEFQNVPYINFDDYTILMGLDQTWGTYIEIVALARALQRPITIYMPNNAQPQLVAEPNYADNMPILLNYTEGNHYEVRPSIELADVGRILLPTPSTTTMIPSIPPQQALALTPTANSTTPTPPSAAPLSPRSPTSRMLHDIEIIPPTIAKTPTEQ